MTGRRRLAARLRPPPARRRRRGGAWSCAAAAKAASLAGLELDRQPRRRSPRRAGASSTLATQAGSGEVDDDPRLAGPEQAEAERLDQRIALGAIARPADRRVDLETDFGHVDDDAVGIDERARIGGHRTGEVEDELRRLAVVGEPRRDRDRRRLVAERRRGDRQAGREPRGRQSKGRQLSAKGHRSSAIRAPFLPQ